MDNTKIRLLERSKGQRSQTPTNSRDRHNQQSKKKAGEAALKAGNHEEAHRLFTEACDVDKHNKKYRLVSDQLSVSKFLGGQQLNH